VAPVFFSDMETTKEPVSERSWRVKISGFLNHQWVLLFIGAIISIPISILITVWFLERPDIRFAINPTRSVIAKQGSAFQVSFFGSLVTNDVSALQFQIWNKGRKAIKRTEILKPVKIQLHAPVHFIETSIRNVTRPEIVNFTFKNSNQPNAIEFSWDILEQNDGAIIQVIYDGPTSVPVSVEGVLEGQKAIEQSKATARPKFWNYVMAMVVLGVWPPMMGWLERWRRPMSKRDIIVDFGFSGFLIVITIITYAYNWFSAGNAPFPF